jgi:hypothetical protein
MTTTGDRLPYLLRALKAPRILERLAWTAERARADGRPHEQFLEALCEAEVFAREPPAPANASATPASPPPRPWRTSTSPPSPPPNAR